MSDEGIDHLGACVHEMFAVIQNQQQTFRLERFDQRLQERTLGLFVNRKRLADRLSDEFRIGERTQFHLPDAIGVFVAQPRSNLDGLTCLARTANSGERQQPSMLQQLLNFFNLVFTSDEAGNLLRKV